METIVHIHDQPMPPVRDSGGSNRLAHWLATEQSIQGDTVYAMTRGGSATEHYDHIELPKTLEFHSLCRLIPSDTTGIEIHGGLPLATAIKLLKEVPHAINIVHAGHGVGIKDVFVSKSHANAASKATYAYNGIPTDDYVYSARKEDWLLFLAKVKRSKKGVDSAIRICKRTRQPLIIAGGKKLSCPETWFRWHPLISPVGYINGPEKYELLSQAKALVVPIRWEEPFGLTVIEAMISGTPVIAFRRGAMSELIVDGVTGLLCDDEEEMVDAIGKVHTLNPKDCREHVLRRFTSKHMYEKHAELLTMARSGLSW